MCGIFCYVNYGVAKTTGEVLNMIIDGLRRVEYRGYDSTGVCVDKVTRGPNGEEVRVPVIVKKVGNVQALYDAAVTNNEGGLDFDQKLENHCGIAHTRWATHGGVTEYNAHPHSSDPDNTFTVIHNGIMTNFQDVKSLLIAKGFQFRTETDTEVIAILTKYLYDEQKRQGNEVSFVELAMEVVSMVQGAFALIFKSSHFPGQIVGARRGSPLIVGIRRSSPLNETVGDDFHGETQQGSSEVFFSSDSAAIGVHTKHVLYLEDEDVVFVRDGKLHILNRLKNPLRPENRTLAKIEIELETMAKGSYAHFMLKEIFEQPDSIINSLRGRINFENGVVTMGGFNLNKHLLKFARRILFISCGTSLNACIAVRGVFDELVDIPIQMENASDFLDRMPPVFRDDVCIFVSQSGETADTLRCLEYCRDKGAILVGFTNVVGSGVSRMTHFGAHLNAGPEIGVASTKAFTSQIICMVLLALLLCEDSISKQKRRMEIIRGLAALPGLVAEVLKACDAQIQALAQKLKDSPSVITLGRGYQLATCMEAALKIKELSYVHTEGINSGELKHGPLALIDENLPVIMMCTKDRHMDRALSAAQQIRARKGRPIAIATEVPQELRDVADELVVVPQAVDCLQSVVNIIPMQLLAYHMAVARGNNVDCPRNLAKSVTTQ